jgi:tetratricopeptide (TPR) repeat protein
MMKERNDLAAMSATLARLVGEPTESRQAFEQAQLLFAFAQHDAALAVLARLADSAEVRTLRQACYEQLAQWAMEVGDLRRAEQAVEQHLRENSGAFRAWAVRGEVASVRGDDQAALECFNYALGALPRDYAATPGQAAEVARLLYLRVVTLARLRRFAEALEHWRGAVERDPENADLWYWGALAWTQAGRADEGLRLCRRALELDARHLDAARLKRQLESGGR